MSLGSAVSGYFDKIVEARFKRDAQGRLMFFPWGFGTGRIVADAATEADLRRVTRRVMISLFVLIVPAVGVYNAMYTPTGFAFLAYLFVCTLVGLLSQFPIAMRARNLPRATERMSYLDSMEQSLDRFGKKFLIFGLVTSILAVTVSVVVLMLPSSGADKISTLASILIFGPLTVVYAVALRRKSQTAEALR